MNYRLLSRVLGLLVLLVGAAMLACLAYAVYDNEPYYAADRALGISAAVTLASGALLVWLGRGSGREILRKEAIAIVGLGWTLCAVFGALPYALSAPALPPAAAFFESASGFTTTGASVMSDVEIFPRGILLWRAMTQWLGGMGILVLFVTILSMLGVGSKSLFRQEPSAQFSEGFASRMRDTALRLWQIYLGLSLVCAAGLVALGMPVFDSVCHAFSTISTGGFSVRNASIGYYASPAIEWWITLFMLLSAVSFMLYAWLLTRRWNRWKQDEETHFYLWLLGIATVLVTASLLHHRHVEGFPDALRIAAFQVVSSSTTTGFATTDYDQWTNFPKVLLIALMFVGGCAGSTAGGVKVGRILVFLKNFLRDITRSFRPRQVIPVRANGVVLPENYLTEVSSYIALIGFIIVLGSVAITLLQPALDLQTGFSAVFATLFNVGPGWGTVGPMFHYGDLQPVTHLALSFLMILGRLEIVAVLALFMPSLWRNY